MSDIATLLPALEAGKRLVVLAGNRHYSVSKTTAFGVSGLRFCSDDGAPVHRDRLVWEPVMATHERAGWLAAALRAGDLVQLAA